MKETLTRASGRWSVWYDGWPAGWVAAHENYDGAPLHSDGPPGDRRCFTGPSRADVVEQIDDHEEDVAA